MSHLQLPPFISFFFFFKVALKRIWMKTDAGCCALNLCGWLYVNMSRQQVDFPDHGKILNFKSTSQVVFKTFYKKKRLSNSVSSLSPAEIPSSSHHVPVGEGMLSSLASLFDVPSLSLATLLSFRPQALFLSHLFTFSLCWFLMWLWIW